jgi:sensor c-di-GMP phosphodiesterase-like protein
MTKLQAQMTRTLKQRIVVTLTATLLAAALGGAFGYMLGCAITLHAEKKALDQYAVRIHKIVQTFVDESFSILTTANASPYPYCSEAEITYFRSLIFRSEYERDLGRMRAGKIDCSATMGRLEQPITVSPPTFVNPDQTKMYRNLPPNDASNAQNNGVQLGDAYIVLTNYRFSSLGTTPMHFLRTSIDAQNGHVGPLRGDAQNLDRKLLIKDGEYWKNGTLYVTRCMTRGNSCTTTYISIHDALTADRYQILVCTILGGLVGAFLGLFCSIIYRRSLSMEHQLRRSIRKDQVRITYQPIVELVSGRIVGAEALARWTDEDGFAINPTVFVRIAEECGIVGELTELVVRHALDDFGETLRSHPEFRININITASDLADPKFIPMLERSLETAQVSPRSLAIEITEGSTANRGIAKEAIRQLREQGHSVQIDDFGTGYSSLAYLHDLSVDAIKIDRAFTQAIGTEAVTVGILPQILSMAQTLNLQVIAEGIETVEQALYFAGSKMTILGQGWLFGRPETAANLLALLAEAEEKTTPVP